jgi:hypothetical protein
MKWLLDTTFSSIREMSRAVEPWASEQWSAAITQWKEQREFYRFVDNVEKDRANQEPQAIPVADLPAHLRDNLFQLMVIAWVDNQARKAEAHDTNFDHTTPLD